MTFKTLSVKKLKCFSSKLVGNFKDHSPGHIARGIVALPPDKGHPSGYSIINRLTEALSDPDGENFHDLLGEATQRPALSTTECTARLRSPYPGMSLSDNRS